MVHAARRPTLRQTVTQVLLTVSSRTAKQGKPMEGAPRSAVDWYARHDALAHLSSRPRELAADIKGDAGEISTIDLHPSKIFIRITNKRVGMTEKKRSCTADRSNIPEADPSTTLLA